jgi:hypothetical protein
LVFVQCFYRKHEGLYIRNHGGAHVEVNEVFYSHDELKRRKIQRAPMAYAIGAFFMRRFW